jgi:hypothetical protein
VTLPEIVTVPPLPENVSEFPSVTLPSICVVFWAQVKLPVPPRRIR